MIQNPAESSVLVDTEVPVRTTRRSFSPKYKQRILSEADQCSATGEIGALLRREGLYSSHIASWRAAREKGALVGLSKKRGQTKTETPEAKELRLLKREHKRLQAKYRRAEKLLEIQKKVSEILGVDLNPSESDERD